MNPAGAENSDSNEITAEIQNMGRTIQDLILICESVTGTNLRGNQIPPNPSGSGLANSLTQLETVTKSFERSYEKIYQTLNEIKYNGTMQKYLNENRR